MQEEVKSFVHKSVLLDEAIEWCCSKPKGVYVDCTFGRGGHTQKIYERLAPGSTLIVFDKDPQAIAHAKTLKTKLESQWIEAHPGFENELPAFHIIHESFAALESVAEEYGLKGEITGILMDLGVSSPQLDDPERGFSFMRDGPLDMRMNSAQGMTAAQWLAQVEEKELARVIFQYGEEKMSRKIAKVICETRDDKPIETTLGLARLIESVVPRRHGQAGRKHPATRSFQAIRIFINKELEDLETVLDTSFDVLASNGRLVVLSFHSLEDRIVKRFMQAKAKQHDQFPSKLPVRADLLKPEFKLLVKGTKPKDPEIAQNVRARSAVLRVGERLRDDQTA